MLNKEDTEALLEASKDCLESNKAFAEKNKLSLDNLKLIGAELSNINTKSQDWFDALRRNKQLYHLIVGSYLASIYPNIEELNHKNEQGNDLEHQQLIDYGDYLFPDNKVIMDISSRYFSNKELSDIIDQNALRESAEKLSGI